MNKFITYLLFFCFLSFTASAKEFEIPKYPFPTGPAIVNGKKIIKSRRSEKLTFEEAQKEVSEHPDKYSKLTFLFEVCAYFNDDERVLQVLIDALKENPKDQQNYLNWIFERSVELSNNVEIIKKLVGLGAEIKGDILLQALQRNPNLDIARYLIEAGADVNARDERGNTALIYLFDRNPKVDAPDIVQKLIDGGVDVNAYDLKNPLEYAHVCGLKETEKLLIKAGAKMERGNTPERLKEIGMNCKKYSNYSRSSIFSDPSSDSM